MVENHSKLEAAFLAGRADATAERSGVVPEGMEDLIHMVLSDGDCMALARLSKVLFHAASPGSTLRVTAPVAALPLIVGNGGSNGDHGRGR
jgi:hypothetical protein